MYITLTNNNEVFTNPDITQYNSGWFAAWCAQYLNRDNVQPTYLNEPTGIFIETDPEKYYKVQSAIKTELKDSYGKGTGKYITFYICTVGDAGNSVTRYFIPLTDDILEHTYDAQTEQSLLNKEQALERQEELANRPSFMDNLADIFGDLTTLAIVAAAVIILLNLGKIKAAAKA